MKQMSYSMWCMLGEEGQKSYLEENNLEVQGYTLVGPLGWPTHVEFCKRGDQWQHSCTTMTSPK